MIDPYRILGVSPDADDETIRLAYLDSVRRCPPERDAARFERNRTAYEHIRNLRQRLRHALFEREQPTLDEVLEILLPATETPVRPSLEQLLNLLGGR
jgi:curved DNA-binding protein CbpA